MLNSETLGYSWGHSLNTQIWGALQVTTTAASDLETSFLNTQVFYPSYLQETKYQWMSVISVMLTAFQQLVKRKVSV